VVLTTLAASGHLAYDAPSFVTFLGITQPTISYCMKGYQQVRQLVLPAATLANHSVRCNSTTVPLLGGGAGGGGRKKLFSLAAVLALGGPALYYFACTPCCLYLVRGFVNIVTSLLHRVSNRAYILYCSVLQACAHNVQATLSTKETWMEKRIIVNKDCPSYRLFHNWDFQQRNEFLPPCFNNICYHTGSTSAKSMGLWWWQLHIYSWRHTLSLQRPSFKRSQYSQFKCNRMSQNHVSMCTYRTVGASGSQIRSFQITTPQTRLKMQAGLD
jgi:hypothetical protein